jgi:hypothetical protein
LNIFCFSFLHIVVSFIQRERGSPPSVKVFSLTI